MGTRNVTGVKKKGEFEDVGEASERLRECECKEVQQVQKETTRLIS